MAHFARIENDIVVDLIVIGNDDCNGGTFPESEPYGQAFIAALAVNDPRLIGTWLQTSYNTRNNVHYDELNQPDGGLAFRLNFGQIGYLFDPDAGEHGEFRPSEGD